MRAMVAVVLALASLPALAQEWDELLARATAEKKPIVVFFRTADCERCDRFESVTLAHPMIVRRLPGVVFTVAPAATDGNAHVAFFDRGGTLRARWPMVPDTMSFEIILDSVVAVASHFDCAVELSEGGAPGAAELEAATGLARLGRVTDARAAVARAQQLGATLKAPAAADTPVRTPVSAIRILPLARSVVSGSLAVKTNVTSAAVARVTFSLDGREVRRVPRPPFSATLDFGPVPQRHSIGVRAFDAKGRELGRDERVVNEAGELFWLRFREPQAGPASGAVRVAMNVRAPAARGVRRVVVSWNDAERAVLTAAPWESVVQVPDGQLGVLRAVAELDDGRTSEDALLLNAGGVVAQSNVQLVELPITVVSGGGATPSIAPERISVREGAQVRRVEAVATAAETPLTIGLLIDVSASMHRMLPDVQEAAIRFLQTILGKRDRAFLITFDSYARLVQPPTPDVTLLSDEIARIHPDGLTALHDAMALGLLQFEGVQGRRAMIVFSDGLDRTSHYRASDVSELSRRVNVPIHVIEAIGDERPDEGLQRIAEATGGTAHPLERLEDLPHVYARIEAALRAQILAFVRTDPATRENEWRPVQVEVQGSGLEVRAPEGYYATW
jgi:VWFA-related protein